MNLGHQKKKIASDKHVNKVPGWIRGGEGVIIWIIFACLINIYCLLGNRHCWVLLHLLFYLITKSSSLADKISQGLPWANELACLVFLRPSCSWRSPREAQGHLVLRFPLLGSCLPVPGWHPAASCQNCGPEFLTVKLPSWSSAAKCVMPCGIHPTPAFLCLSPAEWGGERQGNYGMSRLVKKRFPKMSPLQNFPV